MHVSFLAESGFLVFSSDEYIVAHDLDLPSKFELIEIWDRNQRIPACPRVFVCL